jgi:hypothetical protein
MAAPKAQGFLWSMGQKSCNDLADADTNFALGTRGGEEGLSAFRAANDFAFCFCFIAVARLKPGCLPIQQEGSAS